MTIESPTSTLVKKMCKESSPYRHFNIDILDFAHHVWGLDRITGQKILGMDTKLDPRKLHAYRKAQCEQELRTPFIKFAMHLLSEVALKLAVPADAFSDCFCDVADTEEAPDAAVMATACRTQRAANYGTTDLCMAKQILEFNHHEFRDTGSFLSRRQKSKLMRTFISGTNIRPQPSATRRHLAKSDPRFDAGMHSLHPEDAVDLQNRKRPHESSSSSDGGRRAKRARLHQRLHLATLATECLAATSRRWVTGLFIDTCEVTACYFDRHMVACSASFRFDRQPAVLAMVLYAMNTCTKDGAGFDPHLLPRPLDLSAPGGGQHDPASSVSQIIGSVFDFSFTSKSNGIANGDRTKMGHLGGKSFDEMGYGNPGQGRHTTTRNSRDLRGVVGTTTQGFDQKYKDLEVGDGEEEGQPRLNVTLGLDARDAQATQRPSKHSSTCFRIIAFIRQPDNLVSRGTTVFKVRRRLPNNEFSDDFHALKLSWPLATRLSEVDVINHLERVLPESSHDHLPLLVFSKSWSAQQLALPWLGLKLSLSKENHEERVLRVLASRHYSKLWEAGSLENFKQAWLDCVEVCHLAYRTGEVLHRDLSENNLMVLSMPDGTVKGVLNDWDMAMFIRGADQHTPCRYATGTPPFMAMDLLQAAALNLPETEDSLSSPHWFRHDLESLVYILIWAALHYNLATRERVTEVNRLAAENSLLNQVKPGFEGVAKDWIKPLRRLFKKAMLFGDAAEEVGLEGYDPSTYGGQLTFEKFMKAINVTPRTWGIPNFLEYDP
ncbi:hypothetical protein FA13DRAFT_1794093 [Coprinellus micaceus]|uniref:Fungal-type protein kinase domain-containing protein n=1 Tax=Coprinellus micaceus TaxID=71717 RepID=A0A4Y7T2H3_COPMI|nr:hypothetical protein FA13DRAFT_1794093 [Coprinellus micaceus]